MLSWLPYLIGSVGLTVVLVLSHIAWPIRYWGCRAMRGMGLRLPCPLYCSMCSGVWIGAAVGAVSLVSSHGVSVVLAAPCRFVLDVGAMAFGTSVVAYLVTTWLRSKGEFTEPQHDEDRHEHA